MMKLVIERALGVVPTPVLSYDVMREMLSVVTSIEVEGLSDEAGMLLESFYVGSRRVRGSEMPNTALDTM